MKCGACTLKDAHKYGAAVTSHNVATYDCMCTFLCLRVYSDSASRVVKLNKEPYFQMMYLGTKPTTTHALLVTFAWSYP